MENSKEKLGWFALEYQEKERSKDWFWAFGIIVGTSFITSIIYGNYFFAVLILLGGALLWFFATKRPGLIYYELNSEGLEIRNNLFPYKNIKSFWVRIESERKSTLFIKLDRLFMPIISIPTESPTAKEIHNFLLEKEILEEEMKEYLPEKIIDYLGF
jgi:hypothetical protein